MPFYDDPYPSEKRIWAGVTGRVILFVIIVAVLAGIGATITWAVSTGTAPVRGKAGAYQQKESANNRVFQQANFEKLNGDYQADLTQIKLAQATVDKATKANDVQLEGEASTDLVGVQSHCVQVATTYNAQANSYLAKDFLSADLPTTLNQQACVQ